MPHACVGLQSGGHNSPADEANGYRTPPTKSSKKFLLRIILLVALIPYRPAKVRGFRLRRPFPGSVTDPGLGSCYGSVECRQHLSVGRAVVHLLNMAIPTQHCFRAEQVFGFLKGAGIT